MTSTTSVPTVFKETDRGFRLVVQLAALASPPVPAYLNVVAVDSGTGSVDFSALVFAYVYGPRVVIHPCPATTLAKPIRGRRHRNPMHAVASVLYGVSYGPDEPLWDVTVSGRWRRTLRIELDCTTAGLEFLLGPAYRFEAMDQGAVNAGGPLR